jgi:phage-related tail protein
MGTDPNLTGAPASSDFQLGVFAERLANLQAGITRIETAQQQTVGAMKEMNAAHNTAMLKLEQVEQRTKSVEGDVVDHSANIAKKADETTIKEIETILALKAPQAEVDVISVAVEDLKKSKWMAIGVSSTISAIIAALAIAVPLLVRH